MLQCLLGWARWLAVKGAALALGIPLGLALGVGAVLRPWSTFRRVNRQGQQVEDPLPGLTHEFVTVRGARLHLVRTAAANPAGAGQQQQNKKVLLLLHGFPEGWFSWRHQMAALREEWSVAALSLRGYEDSDRPQDVASYRMRVLVEDVAAVIRLLAPGGQVALAGHDWGGCVAWHVAHVHPELVERLSVLCFPHPMIFSASKMGLDQLRRLWYIVVFQLPWLPELLLSAGDYSVFEAMFYTGPTACKRRGAVGPQDIERCKVAFSRPGALTAALNYYRALLDEATLHPDPSIQRCLHRPLEMPVLLLWAADDAVLRPPLTRGTERHALRLRVHMVPD